MNKNNEIESYQGSDRTICYDYSDLVSQGVGQEEQKGSPKDAQELGRPEGVGEGEAEPHLLPPQAEELQEPQGERGRVERFPLFCPEKGLEGGYVAQSVGYGLNCHAQQSMKYCEMPPYKGVE